MLVRSRLRFYNQDKYSTNNYIFILTNCLVRDSTSSSLLPLPPQFSKLVFCTSFSSFRHRTVALSSLLLLFSSPLFLIATPCFPSINLAARSHFPAHVCTRPNQCRTSSTRAVRERSLARSPGPFGKRKEAGRLRLGAFEAALGEETKRSWITYSANLRTSAEGDNVEEGEYSEKKGVSREKGLTV